MSTAWPISGLILETWLSTESNLKRPGKISAFNLYSSFCRLSTEPGNPPGLEKHLEVMKRFDYVIQSEYEPFDQNADSHKGFALTKEAALVLAQKAVESLDS